MRLRFVDYLMPIFVAQLVVLGLIAAFYLAAMMLAAGLSSGLGIVFVVGVALAAVIGVFNQVLSPIAAVALVIAGAVFAGGDAAQRGFNLDNVLVFGTTALLAAYLALIFLGFA